MSLHVRDLVDNPALRTTLLAGAAGVGRAIHWAHACEQENPWEWLGPDELVMTTGRTFPVEPDAQARFVRQLAAAGLAGLALAEDMGAPPLSAAAVAEADALGFPLLRTAYEVPWVLIARAVAEATSRTGQLTRISRVYDCYRVATLENASDEEVLRRLEGEISAARLVVVDGSSGRPVIPAHADLPPGLAEHVRSLAGAAHLPGITRVADDGASHLILPLAGAAEVLAATLIEDGLDLVVLQHVSAVVSVLAERNRATLVTRLNAGMSVLSLLLEGRLDGEHAHQRLVELSLSPGPWQVLALRGADPLEPAATLRFLGTDRPALVLPGDGHVSVLIRAADCTETVAAALQLVAEGCVGVSDVVRSVNQLGDAVREARWALEAARSERHPVSYYGTERPLFLPRTVSEARDVVTKVLGRLIAYDEAHGTELVRSLQVYFAANRSWQTASRELMVHKQTLVYRMRRIEEITDRELDDLDDITELHLALRSLQLLDQA